MRKFIELVIFADDPDDHDESMYVVSRLKNLVCEEVYEDSIERKRNDIFEAITGFKPIQLNGLQLYDICVKDFEKEKHVKIIYSGYINKKVELEYPYSYITHQEYSELRKKDDELWNQK